MSDDIVARLRAGELVDCGLIEQYALKAANEIERLREAGDALAKGIRTSRWDDALDAWTEVRGG